jgi:hypothetical protein
VTIDLTAALGVGVAGNFTGHLEQAGEAGDFVGVRAEQGAPKGIFPFYVPGADGFLGTFPIDGGRIAAADGNRQLEPEVALIAELRYAEGRVSAVVPRFCAAYNDCSIRKPAARISLKKNWGPATKGLADHWLALDHLGPGGLLDRYRLASWLLRDGELHAYGIDSPVVGYSYFHQTLLDWLADRLNHQVAQGPLEDMAAWIAAAGHPPHLVVSIGATRYTPFCESTFLEPGDEVIVVLYDGDATTVESVAASLRAGETVPGSASVLRQIVD